ncbi:MAG: YifB family Mg chelatase-like AAA ATPase [Propionibacteriales bacterium]|nr:YifB family Mg chelatase-like AAA ATPase [Propionibacteriales bacterium]
MSLARAWSVALIGLDGRLVEVEAAIGSGLPRTVLVGLPDASLYEARDRCKAAVASCGIQWPGSLVTINLSPAALPKAGSGYDLAIIAAVLAAEGLVRKDLLDDTVLVGELGLDGRVRAVRGVLPAVLAASDKKFRRVIVPLQVAAEAELVDEMRVVGVGNLAQLMAVLNGEPVPDLPPGGLAGEARERGRAPDHPRDLADVAGQVEARWALEVAAAGRHHLHLHGPPGVGKTMLAERLPGLLPDLPITAALQVAAVHSLAGLGVPDGLDRRPPYAAPHHSATMASVIGGGPRMARPGSISIAHAGVLFMDEAPEFNPRVLDAMRTPLELGEVLIGRSEVQARFPAQFQLVLASNPCPCGLATTPGARCTCAPMTVRRYAERLSGPIKDRIDISQLLLPMRKSYLRQALQQAETTARVADRVAEARARQVRRFADTPWSANGEASGAHLRTELPPPDGLEAIERAVSRGRLSPRGVDKVLRVAWTLADLAGHDKPGAGDVQAALAMRHGDTGHGGVGSGGIGQLTVAQPGIGQAPVIGLSSTSGELPARTHPSGRADSDPRPDLDPRAGSEEAS